jgi:predicted aspartyl protease
MRPNEPYQRIPVVLNDVRGFQMFIDTGSTRTVIVPRVQQRLRLDVRAGLVVVASGARVRAARAILTSLQIEGFAETRVTNWQVRVMDLPFGDGVLGLDYLSHFAEVCYSFADSALRLTSVQFH